MADEDNGSKVAVYVPEERPSFLKGEIQLRKLLKTLDKASKDALEVLIKIMETTQDEKLKASCAKDILAFHISTAKEVNADQMQRLVAEIRLGGSKGNLVPLESGDDKPKRPVVDFSTIREIS